MLRNPNPTWEVDLFAEGPITIRRPISLNVPKSFNLEDPFYSDIDLRNATSGIQATVTAFASTNQLARKAALFFFGQMLDALTFQINQPLHLSFQERRPNYHMGGYTERRIVEEEEWRAAFKEARLLALSEPTFLRALGWYRKGLSTEDPFDRFLAFWNSIEIVTGKYHPNNERAKSGSKSQMWECFKALWGECNQWPLITDDNKWIDGNYEVRKNIAHGVAPIDIKTVEVVLEKLNTIEHVSHTFLTGWRKNQLDPKIPPKLKKRFGY